MNAALTYLPVYLGLFAAESLAMACNAYIDVSYGSFGSETFVWASVFACGLLVGWRQKGEESPLGKRLTMMALILGAVVCLIYFVPRYVFPRSVVYMLAALQSALNFSTISRRHLLINILISTTLVLFATSHFRANWSMAFYAIPFLIAVAFTLVAEQVNRITANLRQQHRSMRLIGAQGAAIVGATSAIFCLAVLLYALTPQSTLVPPTWQWGQEIQSPYDDANNPDGGKHGHNRRDGQSSESGSAHEMRQMAHSAGMPEWQKSVLLSMARTTEIILGAVKPVRRLWTRVTGVWVKVKRHLTDRIDRLGCRLGWITLGMVVVTIEIPVLSISALLSLLLFYLLWRMARRARFALWVRTRYDYFQLGILARERIDAEAIRKYYLACERLFALNGMPRSPGMNPAEYRHWLRQSNGPFDKQVEEITAQFEQARYGAGQISERQIKRMRRLYREIYRLT